MEGTKLFTLFSYVSLVWFLLLYGTKCETYTVGDDEQWDTTVNYLAWSAKYHFRVNDTLVFTYKQEQHTVYEVTVDTYRSCNASTGVLAKYSSGNDQIKLTKAKAYWFICSIPGHCQDGMRFGINLTEANSPSQGSGTDTTPSSSSNNSSASKLVHLLIHIFGLGIFLV